MFTSKSLFSFLIFASLLLFPINAIRSFSNKITHGGSETQNFMQFFEAPSYQNQIQCPRLIENDKVSICNPLVIHIAMTLDFEYMRGSIAAIHSVLKHSSCPQNIFFHFIASDSTSTILNHLTQSLHSTFPSLSFKVYIFNQNLVTDLISSSVRRALDNPLNYARSYLSDILEPCVDRVIYLDSDVIVVDDIKKLWVVSLKGSTTIGAPEYCNANMKNYFTDEFWSDHEFLKVFDGRKRVCYFNTGVMVMDLRKWREGGFTRKIEDWMRVQKEKRIYNLGSLPPFLLVFGGEVEAIDHKWNQHGLGGDNMVNICRDLHEGPVSLMHWSGKGKPWVRLDGGFPCPVDFLWEPYDLYKPHSYHNQKQGQ